LRQTKSSSSRNAKLRTARKKLDSAERPLIIIKSAHWQRSPCKIFLFVCNRIFSSILTQLAVRPETPRTTAVRVVLLLGRRARPLQAARARRPRAVVPTSFAGAHASARPLSFVVATVVIETTACMQNERVGNTFHLAAKQLPSGMT